LIHSYQASLVRNYERQAVRSISLELTRLEQLRDFLLSVADDDAREPLLLAIVPTLRLFRALLASLQDETSL